ncbi:MAG: enoyl-CoA hydratase/isomerase family protein [Parvibaculum sp.]
MGEIDIWPEQGLAVIKIGNATDLYMTQERAEVLCEAISDAAGDDAVRAIVFTGASPDTFIRHYSLDELMRLARKLQQDKVRVDETAPFEAGHFDLACSLVERCGKPTIAAINGHCMGGGLEFALACDIRIGRRGNFMIGLPEVQVGLLPGGGGTQRLPRLIGYARAVELMFAGGVVAPEEAERIGILNRCVEDPLSEALAYAARVSEQPPEAVAAVKRLARGSWLQGLDDALALERNLFLQLVQTPVAVALMTAQIEKYKRLEKAG